MSTRLLLFNKPFQVLSQFTSNDPRKTLADFIDIADVYPAGRLDYDSEGLMVLTNNGKLQQRISSPKHAQYKGYWVQVEGIPRRDQLVQLQRGVELKDGKTLPARARLIDQPDSLWARNPPIRVRLSVPDSWLDLQIREGRNRQVRRMTAAVGLPTLRLIRYQVAEWSLGQLQPGEYKMVER